MADLRKKVALITGASRGIGAAAAHTLADSGATIVLAARSEADIRRHTDDINAAGGQASYQTCDVTQYVDVQSTVDYCVATYGSIDILVNNAGVIDPIAHLANSDPEAWCHAIDVNVKGVYFGMRAALPIMQKQGSGVVINISSGAANSPLEGWSHYCASKAAALMLTRAADREYAKQGIRIVGLSPGTVATDMQVAIKKSGLNPVSELDWSDHIPPEWVGKAVAFLCTEGADKFAGTDFSLKTDEARQLVGI